MPSFWSRLLHSNKSRVGQPPPLQIAVRSVAAHQHNQDRIWVDPTLPLFVLADGAGGRAGGAEAAEFACQGIQQRRGQLSHPDSHRDQAGTWIEVLNQIDEEMTGDETTGETTAIVATLTSQGQLVGASVGDSSLWLLEGDSLWDVTQNQRRKPFLGLGGASATAFAVSWRASQTLLLASDGLTKYGAPEAIASIVTQENLEAIADELLALVRYPSGAWPDDVSFILARLAPASLMPASNDATMRAD